MSIQDKIHQALVENQERALQWFRDQSSGLSWTVYSSFDIRNSGYKVAPVDANIFPAGFNNICGQDFDHAVELMGSFLKQHYSGAKCIALITEEHTNNAFYWQNVWTLSEIIRNAGKEVRVALPKAFEGPIEVQTSGGQKVEVFSAERKESGLSLNGFQPDLVISNNDFSEEYGEWISGLDLAFTPPHALGWHRRKKSSFFTQYNQLATEFSEAIGLDPFVFRVETKIFDQFDIGDESNRQQLAGSVDQFIADLQPEFDQRGIDSKPFVFVKNNSGTYGLGILQADGGDEVLSWNNKSRKKMKASKGGKGIQQVIIQEGIPTDMTGNGETSEPVIYMIGSEPAGGFLRTHSAKGPTENLNSPGAIYKRLCLSDLTIAWEGKPLESVYGWVARMGALAIAKEAAAAGVDFNGYS